MAITVALVNACGIGLTAEERLQRATEMAAEGDLPAAIIEVKTVLQDDPVNLGARLALADYSLRAGDVVSAAKEYDRALDLGAEEGEFRKPYLEAAVESGDFSTALRVSEDMGVNASPAEVVLRGRALTGAGRTEEAADLYKRVLANDVDNPGARVGLAEIAALNGRLADAVAALEAVPPAGRETTRFYRVTGDLAIRQGKGEAAAAAFRKAIELAQPDPYGIKGFPLQSRLAEAHLVSGDLGEARRLIQLLLAGAPQHPLPNFLAARLELQAGNPDESLKYVQNVLAVQPNVAPVRTLAAAAALQGGNAAQAQNYVAPVVAEDPGNQAARRLLARARLALGQPQSALDTLSPLIGTNADNAEVLGLMSEANVRAGKADEAVATLRRRLVEQPGNEDLRQLLAYTLLRAGRPEEAIATLKSGSPTGDAQLRSDLLKFFATARAGDTEAARDMAASLAERYREKTDIVGLIAMALADAELFGDARKYFLQVVEVEPGNAAAMGGLALIAHRQGDMAESVEWLEKAIGANPANASLMIERAELALEANDREAAVHWLEQAREADPRSLEARRRLAQQYLLADRIDDAIVVIREGLEISPEDAASLNILGLAELAQGRPAAARSALVRAVDAEPASWEARFNLGRAQAALGRIDESRASMEEAVALKPSALRPAAELVVLQLRAGDIAGAAKHFEELQNHHPDDPLTRTLAAELAYAEGRYKDAEASYSSLGQTPRAALGVYRSRLAAGREDALVPIETWMADHPDDQTMRFFLAQALSQSGRREEAIQQYKHILEAAPDRPTILNNLAWEYVQAGDDRALPTAERAFELAPDSAAIQDTLGWVLHKRGDNDKALPLLQSAAAKIPKDPEVRYHLAVVLAETGNQERAVTIARELLADQAAVQVHDDVQALLDRL
jgi:putative PEP-CTERM system TPR-repeat lipoprotein